MTFGRAGSPRAALADAVAASCAVPGYYQPVQIAGRHYIDGGTRSFANADMLLAEGLDTVVCLSPFASWRQGSLLDAAVYGIARKATALQLERELGRLEDAGIRVVAIDPIAPELRAMGLNPMERRHSRRVAETTAAHVAARLDEVLGDVDLTGNAAGDAASAGRVDQARRRSRRGDLYASSPSRCARCTASARLRTSSLR